MRSMRWLLVILMSLAATARARAEDTARPSTAESSSEVSARASFRRLVLSFDTLGLLSNRYGLGVEAVLTERDTVSLYPWYVTGESTGTPDLLAGLYASDY